MGATRPITDSSRESIIPRLPFTPPAESRMPEQHTVNDEVFAANSCARFENDGSIIGHVLNPFSGFLNIPVMLFLSFRKSLVSVHCIHFENSPCLQIKVVGRFPIGWVYFVKCLVPLRIVFWNKNWTLSHFAWHAQIYFLFCIISWWKSTNGTNVLFPACPRRERPVFLQSKQKATERIVEPY